MSPFTHITGCYWACNGRGPHLQTQPCLLVLDQHLRFFSAIADALQWVMERMGVRWVAHYIDDFITMGALGSEECASNSLLMHMACDQMGLPVEPDKDEGPASTLSFLGIELDSVAMEIRL